MGRTHVVPDEPTWPIKPHTQAKHIILEEYLKAWFPILSRYNRRIVYLDGFAGPGVYENGEPGSPIIAIRTAKEIRPEDSEIIFQFIEENKERAEILKTELNKLGLMPQISWKVTHGTFNEEFSNTLKQLDSTGAMLAPTFAFLDPFGYSGIPMSIVSRILGYEKCEVLITLMSNSLIRFSDPKHRDTQNQLFGSAEWQESLKITDTNEHINFLVGHYCKQLQKNGAKYVQTFRMLGDGNNVIYDLVFATQHPKGMEVIKNAMYQVDKRGTYKFSDRMDPNQTYLFTVNDGKRIPDAAKEVYMHYKGESVKSADVKKFIWCETPYRYNRDILKHLEVKNLLKVDSQKKRRLYTYPPESIITFLDRNGENTPNNKSNS